MNRESPIFLLSARRSGSTYLAWNLNSHKNILLTDESKCFIPISRMYHWCRNEKKAEYIDEFREIEERHLYEMIYDFYDKVNTKGATRWGEKSPQYPDQEEYLNCLVEMFPKCHVIHLVRNPYSTILSMFTKGWYNMQAAVDSYIVAHQNLLRIRKKLSKDQYLLVRYEDMHMNRVGKIGEILSFLGETMTDEMKKFIIDHRDHPFSKPTSDITNPMDWVTRLDMTQADYIATRTDGLVKELGYAGSHH